MIKVYEYKSCSTCVKALKYLDSKQIPYTRISITETPPQMAELKKMLSYILEAGGTIKNLFNTSGVQYREMNIADQFKNALSDSDALILLSQNGKLVRRPFLITSNGGLVGFKRQAWDKLLA